MLMIGIPNDPNPSIQFQPLVMLNKSYTVHFPHATPPTLQLQMVSPLLLSLLTPHFAPQF